MSAGTQFQHGASLIQGIKKDHEFSSSFVVSPKCSISFVVSLNSLDRLADSGREYLTSSAVELYSVCRPESDPRCLTCPSSSPRRCSDKGFLNLSTLEYLALLDWTARYIAPGKLGVTQVDAPPILELLQLSGETWCGLVCGFGKLFHTVAGRAKTIDATRTGRRQRRHDMRRQARELLSI